MKRSFRTVDFKHFNQMVQSIQLGDTSTATATELLTRWMTAITEILDEVAPMKSFPQSRKRKPTILTPEIRMLMKQRDQLARKVHKQPGNQELLAELKQMKKRVKGNIRSFNNARGKKLLSSDKTRDAWKFIREVTFTKKKGERTNIDSTVLNDYFGKVVQAEHPDQPVTTRDSCDAPDSFELQELGVNQVQRMLSKIKTETATGHDDLPAAVVKKLSNAMAFNMQAIMNKSLSAGEFPDQWKKANICGIWKGKGTKTDPSNYRPISVLPVLARVLEKEVAKQLTSYCTLHHSIPDQQFGFRALSSCEMALLYTLDHWIKDIDDGNMIGALLIDLSKAFDSVPHQRLLNELGSLGCSTSAMRWFQSYLTNRSQRVIQNGISTNWMEVSRGVPQGSCLSPLLFNIYVRELPRATETDVTQFADDVTNSARGRTEEEIASKLIDGFNATKAFCDEHELTINANKTQLIVFKAPGTKLSPDFSIIVNGCQIVSMPTVTLLGVNLDQHLSFRDHIDQVVRKSHGLIGVLRRASPYLPQPLRKLFYTSIIRSRLEYASTVFSSASKTQTNKLETIQRIAARVICDAQRDAHSQPLLDKLQLRPLCERRDLRVTTLVKNILVGNCHPSMREMFRSKPDGSVHNGEQARIKFGTKRFSIHAREVYNSSTTLADVVENSSTGMRTGNAEQPYSLSAFFDVKNSSTGMRAVDAEQLFSSSTFADVGENSSTGMRTGDAEQSLSGASTLADTLENSSTGMRTGDAGQFYSASTFVDVLANSGTGRRTSNPEQFFSMPTFVDVLENSSSGRRTGIAEQSYSSCPRISTAVVAQDI